MSARIAVQRMIGGAAGYRGPIALALVVMLAGELLLRMSGGDSTALVSLLDVVLIVTPLAGLVLGTTRVHHARDVIELLLAQPVSRRRVFFSLWLRDTVPLALALALGVIAPFVWHGSVSAMALALAGAAALLAVISQTLAYVIALRQDDRVRALVTALAVWLTAAVIWDGMLLLLALLLADRPIEGTMLALLAINPVDLVRVLMLLGSDAAAMLGYTGAVVSRALGTTTGRAALGAILALWLTVPIWVAARQFGRKDF
ncbi:MAG TPA: ABC transporter permease subunit [Gemmatimonadales bacterium]|nr:ABC transporter permease subunit [Gemmatimonadales bacterium]